MQTHKIGNSTGMEARKVQRVHRKAKHKNPKREYRMLKSSIEKLFQNLYGKKIIKVGIVHRKVNTKLRYGRKEKYKKKLNLPIHEEASIKNRNLHRKSQAEKSESP